jgi:C1A family cysteine protease
MEGLIGQSFQSSLSTRKKLSISLLGILLISALLLSTFSSSSPQFLSTIDAEEQEFQRYLSLFSKSYPSSELSFRRSVFQSNCAKIREHNSENGDVILAVNKFADLTHEEFKAMYTSPHPAPSSNFATQEETLNQTPVPSVDWRDKGAVTDVSDQKNCTAGWAFAAAGAVEAAWQIAGNPLEDLSVQELLDCVLSFKSNGCKGGLVSDALAFVQSNNLTSDLIYPFIAYDMECIPKNELLWVSKIKSYTQVTPNNTQKLIAAVEASPVAAAVEADQYVWQFYNSGVIYKFCGTQTNHNVLVVGYDLNNSFLIAKNSWGQDWGESGYVRIGIGGASAGVCGINTNAFWANSTGV